jgi:hypothetical protein
MPQPLFDVYFRGALLPDADPAQVRDRLATLFGLSTAELERLFSGASVCVKRGLDVDGAAHLRGRFRDAGALVDIRPAEATRAAPPPVGAPATPLAQTEAEAEARAEEPWTVAPPQTGSLAEYARAVEAAPLPDISRITLAPAGAPVSDATAPPPPAIDTSHLSLSEPNTGSLEDCRQDKPARPVGDIGHLKLDDG